MTDLPTVKPLAVVQGADLGPALTGVEPGWYKTADLLPRYNAWAESNGKPTVTGKTLGEAIRREYGATQSRRAHGNVTMWYLDEKVLAHRDWHTGS